MKLFHCLTMPRSTLAPRHYHASVSRVSSVDTRYTAETAAVAATVSAATTATVVNKTRRPASTDSIVKRREACDVVFMCARAHGNDDDAGAEGFEG